MRAWENFLKTQEKEIGTATVKKWLSTLRIVRFDAANLYLEAKDSFQAHWFEEHIRPELSKLLSPTNRRIKVHLTVAKGQTEDQPKVAKKAKAAEPLRLRWEKPNSQETLANFHWTPENEIIHKLLDQVVNRTVDASFNPIFLYGPPGSGKSHLLNAVAYNLEAAGIKTIYVKASTFTEHVVEAIRAGQMQQFRAAYRHADVLIIDDIQIFSNRSSTQEEFFHTFNTLHVDGHTIIVSGNTPPRELVGVEPRLVSRFEWGIALGLAPLKKNDLKKLLLARAAERDLILTERAQDFLLDTFTGGTKSLMRALDAISLRLPGKPMPTSEELKKVLGDLIQADLAALVTPQKVIKAVADHWGILVEDILGKSQSRDAVLPRQVAMSLCRHQLELPFTKIGALFDRDHSTVISAIRHILKKQEEDKELASSVHSLTKQLFYKGL